MVNVHLIFLTEEIGMFQKYVSIKVSVNLYEDNRKNLQNLWLLSNRAYNIKIKSHCNGKF